jgi:zinc protease
MFRGTERYSPAEYNDVLKRLGADANASTWDDRTVYYMTGPASGFATMAALEADRFQHLEYTEPAFRTEALAVLGEYNKAASNPFLALEERLRSVAFTTHTYRHTTLGFLEDVKRMPEYYEYSLAFFERFYRPDNVTVVAVGDIAAEPVFSTVAQYFGDWKPGYQPASVPAEPPQQRQRTARVMWPQPTRPYLMLGYHAPAFSALGVDYAALDIIAELLFSDAAPLHQLLVVDRQWADFLQGGAEDHRDPYLFTVAARVKSSDLLDKTKAAIDERVGALQREPIEAARLKRVQSHLRYRFALALDTPDGIASTVSHYVGLTGSVDTINELFKRYQQVTPGDVQRVANNVFRPGNETMVTLDGPPQPAGDEKR